MTLQRWSFAEEEGGTTVIEADDEHLTLALYGGPDCDRTTTERHYEYLPTEGEERDESTGPMRWDVLQRYRRKPHDAFLDDLWFELGSTLYCHPLINQPDVE